MLRKFNFLLLHLKLATVVWFVNVRVCNQNVPCGMTTNLVFAQNYQMGKLMFEQFHATPF